MKANTGARIKIGNTFSSSSWNYQSAMFSESELKSVTVTDYQSLGETLFLFLLLKLTICSQSCSYESLVFFFFNFNGKNISIEMESLQTYKRMKTRSIYTRILRKFYFWMDGNSLLFKLVILTPTVRLELRERGVQRATLTEQRTIDYVSRREFASQLINRGKRITISRLFSIRPSFPLVLTESRESVTGSG